MRLQIIDELLLTWINTDNWLPNVNIYHSLVKCWQMSTAWLQLQIKLAVKKQCSTFLSKLQPSKQVFLYFLYFRFVESIVIVPISVYQFFSREYRIFLFIENFLENVLFNSLWTLYKFKLLDFIVRTNRNFSYKNIGIREKDLFQ